MPKDHYLDNRLMLIVYSCSETFHVVQIANNNQQVAHYTIKPNFIFLREWHNHHFLFICQMIDFSSRLKTTGYS